MDNTCHAVGVLDFSFAHVDAPKTHEQADAVFVCFLVSFAFSLPFFRHHRVDSSARFTWGLMTNIHMECSKTARPRVVFVMIQ